MAPIAGPYFPPQLASFFLADHHVAIQKPPERHLTLYCTQIIAGRLPPASRPPNPPLRPSVAPRTAPATRTVESHRSSLCEPPTLVIDPACLFLRAASHALRPYRTDCFATIRFQPRTTPELQPLRHEGGRLESGGESDGRRPWCLTNNG